MCVDESGALGKARAFAAQEKFSFPIVFATEDVAGIYNIIYRYLFDRRRDLAIPTSFLLDREGMIVKVYQGAIVPERLLEDVRSIPTTAAGRMQKAMPLGGVLYQGGFQRNDFTYGVALFQHGIWRRPRSHFNRWSPQSRMILKATTTWERSTCGETTSSRHANICNRL